MIRGVATGSEAGTAAKAVRSVRLRLTLVATVIVAVVLVAAAVLLLGLQRRQLVEAIDEALVRRADQLEDAAARGAPASIDDVSAEDRGAQLATVDGQVLASTSNLADSDAIADVPDDDEDVRTSDVLRVDEDAFRVLSRRITIAGEPGVVHVAESIDDIDESVGVLARSLAIAFPFVLVAVGATTWWLVGRALRPVVASAGRQERFVSDASHELRSPLGRIRNRLEVDLGHPDGVDLRDTANAVLNESKQMERLVDGLLHLARADGASPRTVPVDLDDIVLRESALVDLPGFGVDTSAVSAGLVRGDPGALGLLVRNLIENAIGHGGRRVVVGLREHGNEVVLTVDDDGPGIPAARRAEVFERFTRLDDSRAPGAGGTGLGLAIAHDVAMRHGGTIDVDEAPIGGARLTVTLPASSAPA